MSFESCSGLELFGIFLGLFLFLERRWSFTIKRWRCMHQIGRKIWFTWKSGYMEVSINGIKWGYPQMDGLQWKILPKWMVHDGTTIFGNLHIAK